MFCFRKTSPAAPCSCAFHLRSPIPELLNHLPCLGNGTLILRRPGLSVAKSTPFGLHIRERATDWDILRDAISGLETNLRQDPQAYLLRQFPDDSPLFAMGLPGQPIEFTVRLTNHAWNSPAILEMIRRFNATPLDCIESRRLGAGAWLDEWEQPKGASSPSPSFLRKASSALQHCRRLEVEIRTSSQRGTARFQPSFIDSAGPVVRIADKLRQHIVYADTSSPSFRLIHRGPDTLHLSHVA